MNYFLQIAILLVIGILYYIFIQKDIFSPIIMSIMCYLLSLFFCIIMIPYWKYDISLKSVFVVSITFMSMALCSFAGYRLANNFSIKRYNADYVNFKEFSIKKKSIIFILALIFSLSIIKNYYNIAYNNGFEGNWYEITKLSAIAKSANLNKGAQLLRINTYMQYFLKGITYCSIFLFVYNVVVSKKDIKKNLYLLFFVIPYLLVIYVSGWRTDFLFITIYTLVIFGINIGRLQNKKIVTKQSFVVIIALFIIVLIIWMGTYIIRSKGSFDIYKILDYISTYFGGGIVNFDQYLNGEIIFSESKIFGERIFTNIYYYLNRLHITNVSDASSILPHAGVLNTNIYSGFFRGYVDFGLLGNCIYLGSIFFIYSFIFSMLSKYKNMFFVSILYSYHCYPICLMGVEEAFSLFFISTMPLYVIFFYGITYYFMIYKDNKKELAIR